MRGADPAEPTSVEPARRSPPDRRPQVVIVTGAAGYIGSHVCEALLRRGDAVVAIDAFTAHYDPARKRMNLAAIRETAQAVAAAPGAQPFASAGRWPLGNFVALEGDVRLAADLDAAFGQAAALGGGRPVWRVIHLAARAGVRGALAESAEYVDLNVAGTHQVLEACRRHGLGSPPELMGDPAGGSAPAAGHDHAAGHLVMASSSTVYGSGPAGWDGPFSESLAADEPLSVYGASKRAGELLGHVYAHLARFRVTCLRFFGVIGPRLRTDLSAYRFTEAVWRGRPIDKFGDGTTARDYTYVGDIVEGVLAALDRFELAAAGVVQPGGPYECINLGNDRPVTLNDYLAALERLLGKPVIIRQLPEHPMDAKRTWADLTKAKRLLGYQPQTTFEQALRRCVEWYLRDIAGIDRPSAPAAGVPGSDEPHRAPCP